MHKQVVLDPPRVFFYVWKIAKPILPKKTVERMVFCQTAEYITSVYGTAADKKKVPRIAGGACECNEDKCLNRFKMQINL